MARLRGREERAFEEATSTFYPAMFAVARAYVRSGSDAEEVVQDAWLGVLKGLERFRGTLQAPHVGFADRRQHRP